jgi:uncharacterized protein YndB with AHSA1/START domain
VQLSSCVFNLAHTVSRSVKLDAPPEQVWEALTEESALAEWLAPEVELDPVAGGEVRCRYEDGTERRGEVELVEEAERLSFRWHREEGGALSRVEFLVEAVAEGSRVTVVETRLTSSPTPLLATAWSLPLGRLRLTLGRLVLA